MCAVDGVVDSDTVMVCFTCREEMKSGRLYIKGFHVGMFLWHTCNEWYCAVPCYQKPIVPIHDPLFHEHFVISRYISDPVSI